MRKNKLYGAVERNDGRCRISYDGWITYIRLADIDAWIDFLRELKESTEEEE